MMERNQMVKLPSAQNLRPGAQHRIRTSQEENAERSRWAPAWVSALLVSFCQEKTHGTSVWYSLTLHAIQSSNIQKSSSFHTQKHSITEPCNEITEKIKSKQSFKKATFKCKFSSNSTSAMISHKQCIGNPSQTQKHSHWIHSCSPASQGMFHFPTFSQTQSEFSRRAHSGPVMVSLDLCTPVGTQEAFQDTWQNNYQHRQFHIKLLI